jgi:hypothetical protein
MRNDDTLPPVLAVERRSKGLIRMSWSTPAANETLRTPAISGLVGAYCETCTHEIEEAYKRNDEQVETMRRELDSLPKHRKTGDGLPSALSGAESHRSSRIGAIESCRSRRWPTSHPPRLFCAQGGSKRAHRVSVGA